MVSTSERNQTTQKNFLKNTKTLEKYQIVIAVARRDWDLLPSASGLYLAKQLSC